MQKPSKDSTSKSPSSHPDQPPPPVTADPIRTVAGDFTGTEEGGSRMGGDASSDARIAQQVVDPTLGGDGSPAGAAAGSSEALVSVEGGVAAAAEKQGKQKRKASQLSDPPPWPPKCNECGKEFPSWKAAFGHMRAHPDRDYRGFFKPPTSSSSSSPTRQRVRLGDNINRGVEQGGGEIKRASSASGTRGVGFDLNQPMMEEVEEESNSEAAERSEAHDSSSSALVLRNEEQKKVGFDLNQLPPSEEDDDPHKP
ncbi:uncharacterized protein LOC129310892 [Prosopis cineraria]|uniref:uncharacterized protein LOC129310892 n=1 Tax=Prosopis cineraria TaxID=364024 RepID=UPI00240EF470|nr:uncharacterized protein LOC129310892 [Prosopis cineraria]